MLGINLFHLQERGSGGHWEVSGEHEEKTERRSSLPGQSDGPEVKGRVLTGVWGDETGRVQPKSERKAILIFSHVIPQRYCTTVKANKDTETSCYCKAFIEERRKTPVDYMPLPKIKNRRDALL